MSIVSGETCPESLKRLIGITGGIGAGKSVVSRILRGLGYPVFDCDHEAKALMTRDPEVVECLKRLCGSEIYEAPGSLNRKLMASLIFSDTNLLAQVNKLVHEAVKRELMSFYEKFPGVVFVEAAILASSGLAEMCAGVWYVDAPEELRISRALTRGSISEKDLRARIIAQARERSLLEQKVSSLKVIDNSPDSSLLNQIQSLLIQ